jgi:hypothetical protein
MNFVWLWNSERDGWMGSFDANEIERYGLSHFEKTNSLFEASFCHLPCVDMTGVLTGREIDLLSCKKSWVSLKQKSERQSLNILVHFRSPTATTTLQSPSSALKPYAYKQKLAHTPLSISRIQKTTYHKLPLLKNLPRI